MFASMPTRERHRTGPHRIDAEHGLAVEILGDIRDQPILPHRAYEVISVFCRRSVR